MKKGIKNLHKPVSASATRMRLSSKSRAVTMSLASKSFATKLLIALLICMVAAICSTVAFAQENDNVATGTIDGSPFTATSNDKLWDTINNKSNKTIVVNMLKDCVYNQTLKIGESTNLTLNLNGHMFSRNDSNGRDHYKFYVNKNAELTINGGTDTTSREVQIYTNRNRSTSKPIIKGGVISGCKSTGNGGAFYVPSSAANAKININDTTIAGNEIEEYWDDTAGYGGAIYSEASNFQLSLNNSTITGNWAEECAGGIGIGAGNSVITMNNSHIDGNIGYDDCGGLLYYTGENILRATDSTFSNNLTYEEASSIFDWEGYGGAIYLNSGASSSKLYFENCELNNNRASFGGAIYTNADSSVISGDAEQGNYEDGTTLSGNQTGNDGGAIYTYKAAGVFQSSTISGLNIKNNTSGDCGGGICINSEGCSINNCNITGNTCQDTGGGVDDYQDYLSMSNCDVINNKNEGSTEGGGIFINQNVDLSLSGTMRIYDNYDKNNTEDDIMIGNGTTAQAWLFAEGLNYESRIGIDKQGLTAASNANEERVSSFADSYDTRCFFSNNDTYGQISYVSKFEPNGDGYLKFVKGAKTGKQPIKEPTVVDGTPTSSEDDGSGENVNGYPVINGYVKYGTVSSKNCDNATPYYYSDGYFVDNTYETKYNDALSALSMAKTMAGFNALEPGVSTTQNEENVTGDDYIYQSTNVIQFYGDIGCDQDDIYVNDYLLSQPTTESIGVSIAKKDIEIQSGNNDSENDDDESDGSDDSAEDGNTNNEADNDDADTVTLVPITIRGAGYEAEWASNLTIGETGEANGFADAATKAMESVKYYISQHKLEDKLKAGKVRFWVSGFSRGGAVANLLSKRLTDTYRSAEYNKDNIVFAYTYEAPSGGLESEITKTDYNYQGVYKNIHNVVNCADIVVKLAPNYKMGFIRYGVSHYMPGSSAGDGEPKVEDGNYFDNDYWQGTYHQSTETDYYKLREKMIKHLSCLDCVEEQTYWDDYFQTATLEVFKYAIAWNTHLIQYKGDSADKNYNVKYYLDEFIKALCDHGLNYNSDPRVSYTTNVTIGSKDYGTVQASLQEVMRILFTKDTATIQKITDCLSNVIGKLNVLDWYKDVLQNWNSLTDDKKNTYISQIISAVLEPSTDGSSIADYLTTDEINSLTKNLPATVDMLCKFANWDYETKSFDTDETLIYLGTILANYQRLLANHYQETVMAWLEAADANHYDKELTNMYTYKLKAITPPTPQAKISASSNNIDGNLGGEDESTEVKANDVTDVIGNCTLSLDTSEGVGTAKANPGATIYYTTDGSDPSSSETRQLYRGTIALQEKTNGYNEYVIRAYSYAYGVPSDVVTYTIHVYGKFDYTLQTLNAQGTYDTVTYSAYPETEISITCLKEVASQKFEAWSALNEGGQSVTSKIFDGEAYTLNETKFTMPKYKVTVLNNYTRDSLIVRLSTWDDMSKMCITPQVGQKLPNTVPVTWSYKKGETETEVKSNAALNGMWYKVSDTNGEVPDPSTSTSGLCEFDTQYAFVVNLQEDLTTSTPITYNPNSSATSGDSYLVYGVTSDVLESTHGLGKFTTKFNESDYSVTLIYYPPKTSGAAACDADGNEIDVPATSVGDSNKTYDTTPQYVKNMDKTVYVPYVADAGTMKTNIKAAVNNVAVDSQVKSAYGDAATTPSYADTASGISVDFSGVTFEVPVTDGKTTAGSDITLNLESETGNEFTSTRGKIKVVASESAKATAKITVHIEEAGYTTYTPPTPDKAANRQYAITYDDSVSPATQEKVNVKLSTTASTGYTIKYRVDSGEVKDYTDAGIELDAPTLPTSNANGYSGDGSAEYTISTYLVDKDGNQSSTTATYKYSVLNRPKYSVTMNFKAVGLGSGYNPTIDSQKYYFYLDSTPFSIVAPTLDYEAFTSWSETEGQKFLPSGASHEFTACSSGVFNKNVTILGTYYPIISSVEAKVAALDPTKEYPSAATSFKLVSRESDPVELDPATYTKLTWSGKTDTKTKPDFQETSSATLELLKAYFTESIKFGVKSGATGKTTFASTQQLTGNTLNGSANADTEVTSSLVYENKTQTRYVASFKSNASAPTTRKAYITGITTPTVSDIPNGIELADIINTYMPSTVAITSELTAVNSASITWNRESVTDYNPDNLHGGTYNIKGTVTLPESLANPEGTGHVELTITATFTTNDAGSVAMPIASSASGDYLRVETYLTCNTEGADIYYTYTNDGTEPADPATSGTLYTPGTLLTFGGQQDTKIVHALKMCAKKKDMLDSATNTYTYTINYAQYANKLLKNDGEWKQLSGKEYNFQTSDFLNTSSLGSLKCDGAEVDAKNYSYKVEASAAGNDYPYVVNFTLTPEFMATLSLGNHNLVARFLTTDLTIPLSVIDADTCYTPTTTVAAGKYYEVTTKIECQTEGAEIYYTTDGSDPSREGNAGKLYDGEEITFTSNPDAVETHTVKTIAYHDGMRDSAVGEYEFVLDYSLKPKPGPDPDPEPTPTPTPQPENVDAVGNSTGSGTSSTNDSLVAICVIASLLALGSACVVVARRRRQI